MPDIQPSLVPSAFPFSHPPNLAIIRGLDFGSVRNDWRTTEGSDMLVLSRKLGEKIFIGDNICITVVDIDRGKIRLGIEAPRDVPIYRQELLPLDQQRPGGPANVPAVS
jgi:carbon storage regulator